MISQTAEAYGLIRDKCLTQLLSILVSRSASGQNCMRLQVQTGSAHTNLIEPHAKMLLSHAAAREQRAIAHILGTLDDKIELNRRMNETLEAMARAIFKSWFVDFDPVRAKAEGRDPGLPKPIADLFPDRFEDSELGEIPAGWKIRSLYDCAEYINGSAFRNEHFSLDRSGLPIIKIAELKDGITGKQNSRNTASMKRIGSQMERFCFLGLSRHFNRHLHMG